jgi:hypothetical protein
VGEEACFGVHLRGKQERKRDDEVRMMEELEGFWKGRLYDLDTHVIILRGMLGKGEKVSKYF